ncbi:hypothetical protein EDB81DRAFT_764761 [Dactylonectria macrodidyma]|uniref:DUF7924 domain-containing protein n=1 Tax=Dactylonectria macrodidyma TaxID=307937 RepID=A0A9P9DXL2_9HYPO|nr:hypothetical protein EDB81DRAFT_764761 [Dactylonectria macrodidyma]
MEDHDPTGTQKHGQVSCPIDRLKLSHPSFPPPSYFDNLSRQFLTKYALQELGRRNKKIPLALEPQQLGPLTRLTVAKWKKSHPSAESLIRHYDTKRWEQLRCYAKHGGPDLTDLRGFDQSSPLDYLMSQPSNLGRRKRAKTTESTKPTKTTGVYDRNFTQHLVDHGFFPVNYMYPDGRSAPKPENMNEILQALALPRASLSQLSDQHLVQFTEADAAAFKERDVVESVIPLIGGHLKNEKTIVRGLPFSNLCPLTDVLLVAGNPDQYHGARPEQLHQRVREELKHMIMPTTQMDLPIAPNFFVEVKGPEGAMAVMQRQACYAGALGARGMHSLQSYASRGPAHDNKAYTISATYFSGGLLKLYAHHLVHTSTPGAGVRTECVMTQLKGFDLTSDIEAFRNGVAAYQNAVEWCRLQRDQAIEQANRKVSSPWPSSNESETAENELAGDLQHPSKRPC